jgi:hypothetical protein
VWGVGVGVGVGEGVCVGVGVSVGVWVRGCARVVDEDVCLSVTRF